MAVPNTNFDQLSAITRRFFIPKLVDNIFDSNALLQRARGTGGWYQRVSGGTKFIVPVAYATTTASNWFSGSETLDIDDNDQLSSAEFDWKEIYANITITKLDELKNSGEAAVVDFVRSKVQMAEKTLADNLGTGLYNVGTAAKEIIGLRLAVDSTGTYGGINRSNDSWWAAQEDGSTTTLSMPALQSSWGSAKIDNDVPTVHMTTQTQFNKYYGLLQPQQRFQDNDTANGGFTNLVFNGKPVIVDSHVPAKHWFMLNEEYIMLKVHRDSDFAFEDFVKPTNQAVKTAKIFWHGALCINNCRLQAKLNALT